MASQVGICNRALIRLGADTISSISEDSKEARLCNILYDQIRQDLLRSHPWNFAVKRVILAPSATDPEFEFATKCLLPSDCLRVYKLYEAVTPYKVEGKYILSDNEELVNLIYIADITDPAQFDSMFTTLFVLKLAKELSYNITGVAGVAESLEDEFVKLRREARLFDGQEDFPDDFGDGDWLDSRV